MALEQLGLGVSAVDGGENDSAPSNEVRHDGVNTARLPRWTRPDILVLIQGKRVAENRVQPGRAAGMALGSGQMEPKWPSVSSYCRRHGVNRGPVQCRHKWNKLAGDHKKIKEWESQIKEETESYWVMRNDVRREKKLPVLFDKEVYDIVDGGVIPSPMEKKEACAAGQGRVKEKHAEAAHREAGSTSQEERKRKRTSTGKEKEEEIKSMQNQ